MTDPTSSAQTGADVWVELHGSTAPMHAFVAGDDSFAAKLSRLEQRPRDERFVATWVSRPAMRHLLQLCERLGGLGVVRWRLRFMLEGEERLVPRLSMAAPRALQAAKAAQRAGMHVELEGAPLCVLGPFRSLLVHGAKRSFTARCEGCEVRNECQGIAAGYAARFGGEDLRTQHLLAQRTGSISSQP
ncbi:MAG: hypothetical protein AAF938_19830 [Myxococcota bacterium]